MATEAMQLSRELDDQEGVAMAYLLLGDYYMNALQFDKAKENALKALQVATKSQQPENEKKALLALSDISLGLHNINDFTNYRRLQDSIDIVLLNRQIIRNTQELEKKYETEKKNLQIQQLEKDKRIQTLSIRQKNILNDVLIGAAITILIISLLVYRTYRQKQLLQQKKIQQLEKEKQLLATEALLKGQEDERIRLAKDLHDGLGGLLSGVKFSLSNMRDNFIVTPENMSVFERSLDMIDTSIKELRRVAYNMMPEMLSKFGLDEALKEYCSTVNATKLLTVKYQSLGMDLRLDTSVEIIVFRIVQELLNNIMKHAAATEALVQLIREDNRFNVVVEDNGKGFDVSMTENSSGAGWINIRSRVDYLKGQLDIHTETGKGTLVNIEFNV